MIFSKRELVEDALKNAKTPTDNIPDTFRLAAVCYEHAIPDAETPALILAEFERRGFTSPTSDAIAADIAAVKLCGNFVWGSRLDFNNFTTFREETNTRRGIKETTVPESMPDLLASLLDYTDNKIGVADGVVFFDDPQTGITYCDRNPEATLFGYLKSRFQVTWKQAPKGAMPSLRLATNASNWSPLHTQATGTPRFWQ